MGETGKISASGSEVTPLLISRVALLSTPCSAALLIAKGAGAGFGLYGYI